ncbi:sucrase ferredoxin [Spongiactinospora gelatinilytica]|uniref:Sucrase ferredoxin n=1 Tax=Spongiactinospora gelatinilytica TaxID=2666298 RepID=A0A2W2EF71_9ACTN|nr:sucrase ferredoxin [Spongiactinospora gelatinilytica]
MPVSPEPEAAPKGCSHPRGCHTGDVPTLASATVGARSWLLIEHDGPWAARLPECRVPDEVAALIARASAAGVRPQLIRRPGKRTRSTRQGVHVLLAHSTGDTPWLAEGVFADPDDLDLDSLVRGVVPESCILVSEPVFLVCTHAKRNACCARIGLPLARYLGENLPGRVWETSHVGGDRYAANLVCLPHGLYYGNMSEAAALAAANAYRHGEVVLDRFRGRAGIPEPLQAAEHFVRDHTGELSVGGVAVESSRSDGDVTTAVMRHGDARFRVVVEPMVFPTPCGTACAETITTYRLVSLDRLTPVRYAMPALT